MTWWVWALLALAVLVGLGFAAAVWVWDSQRKDAECAWHRRPGFCPDCGRWIRRQ